MGMVITFLIRAYCEMIVHSSGQKLPFRYYYCSIKIVRIPDWARKDFFNLLLHAFSLSPRNVLVSEQAPAGRVRLQLEG